MTITARVYISEITHSSGDKAAARIKFSGAYNKGKGNEAWATATPSLTYEMYVSNPTAVAWFEQRFNDGKDMHVTFDDVEPATD